MWRVDDNGVMTSMLYSHLPDMSCSELRRDERVVDLLAPVRRVRAAPAARFAVPIRLPTAAITHQHHLSKPHETAAARQKHCVWLTRSR